MHLSVIIPAYNEELRLEETLRNISEFFSKLCKSLIVEFVPKSDSQVERLLATRVDVFPQYNQADFESIFQGCFRIVEAVPVANSERTLYLMEAIQK